MLIELARDFEQLPESMHFLEGLVPTSIAKSCTRSRLNYEPSYSISDGITQNRASA